MSKRTHVPGLVLGACAYGKSNVDKDREYLRDYSGNGRDIRLYNFSFSGMSGYGGYGSRWTAYGDSSEQVDSNTIKFGATRMEGVLLTSLKKGESYTIRYRITGLPSGSTLNLYTNTRNLESINVFKNIRTIERDGIYTDTVTWDSENAANDSSFSSCFLVGLDGSYPEGMSVLAEQLPLYPGGLVSDGVDDYGQCIKGFSLPDDYTVVAVRRIFDTTSDSAFVSKSRTAGQGAFIFDINKGGYSYGNISSGAYNASLFSYQTKTSYNGVEISPGSGTDTADDILCLFRKGVNRGDYLPAVLYDLRIYDHSLTDDELQLVKDEMMEDYYRHAEPMKYTHWVADWDAKGRSNDEDADVRDEWADKVGGSIISLSNYDFGGKSGWGEYPYNFSNFQCLDQTAAYNTVSSTRLTANAVTRGITFRLPVSHIPDGVFKAKLKITGLDDNPDTVIAKIRLYSDTSQEGMIDINEDGIYDIEYHMPEGASYFWVFCFGGSASPIELATPIYIDILPTIAGVLASDGVDDYIRTEEGLNAKVGTMLIHWKNTGLPVSHYLFTSLDFDEPGRLYCWNNARGNITCGTPHMQMDGKDIMVYTREPVEAISPLISTAGDNPCPIYRLIFIQEQLDEQQTEALKWKVDKEYRDWLKEKGWAV